MDGWVGESGWGFAPGWAGVGHNLVKAVLELSIGRGVGGWWDVGG